MGFRCVRSPLNALFVALTSFHKLFWRLFVAIWPAACSSLTSLVLIHTKTDGEEVNQMRNIYGGVPLILVLLLQVNLYAQEFEQTSRVLLREVRMHVVDKDGNHVPGLKPPDFTIEEDGQTYQLSFFEEVDRSKPAETVTEYKEIEGVMPFSDSHQTGPRKLTLILDTANFSQHFYDEMMKEVETFILENVEPSTMIQIIQIDGDIYPLTGYTPDRSQLREALGKAEYRGTLINQLKALDNSILNGISQSIQLSASNQMIIDKGGVTFAEAAFVNDDKGGGFWSSVDQDVHQKAYFKQLHYRKFTVQMLRVAHALRRGTGSQSVLLITGGQFVEEYGLYPNSLSVAETLSQAFNGVGIPLFIHLPKPKQALSEGHAQSQANLTLSGGPGFSWDFDSLSQASSFDPTREDRIRLGPYRTTVMENLQHMEGAPRYAAEWTGGQLTIDNNTSSINQRLEQLFDAAGKYYRLGYTRFIDDVPKVVKTDIRISGAKENKWKVRYGKEALPKYGLEDRPKQPEMGEIPEEPVQSVSRMLHLGEPGVNDYNLSQGYFRFPSESGKLNIPVYMRLPQPQKPSEKGYEFGFAALDSEGTLLDHTVFAIKPGFDKEPMLFYDMLMPTENPAEIRYFIREIGGETQSFQSVSFEQVPAPEISPLLLSDGSNTSFVVSPHHIRAADKDRAAADPLLIEKSIFPFTSGDLIFNKPQSLRFFFAVKGDQVDNPLEFEMWLENQDEDEIVPKHNVQMLPVGDSGLKRFQGLIDTTELPPGNYTLYTRVYDSVSDKEHMQNKSFAVIWKEKSEP